MSGQFKKIISFFETNASKISIEDNMKYQTAKPLLVIAENTNVITTQFNGQHFVTCHWADDRTKDGVDTCNCSHVSVMAKRLCDIINKYDKTWMENKAEDD